METAFLFKTLCLMLAARAQISDAGRAKLLICGPKFQLHFRSPIPTYPGTPGFSDPASHAFPSA